MLTPKAKVWKVLKKVKKNWSHELKRASSHYYENVRCQVERRTLNHWLGRLGSWNLTSTGRLPDQCRLIDKLRLLHSNRIMWGRWSNKFWNRKIHGWFHSHFLLTNLLISWSEIKHFCTLKVIQHNYLHADAALLPMQMLSFMWSCNSPMTHRIIWFLCHAGIIIYMSSTSTERLWILVGFTTQLPVTALLKN